MSTKLDKLQALHPEIVSSYLETKESKSIDKDLQQYIDQLTWAAEIRENDRNISRAAQMLRIRILSKHRVNLSLSACKQRIYDSMEYLHVDNNVSQKVWDMDAADKFEDLFKLAVAEGKLDAAGRFLREATELRRRANSAMEAGDIDGVTYIISDDVSVMDLEGEDENLKKIQRRYNEGYYSKMINDLPIEKEEKEKLYKDAGIEDVDFEEVSDE
jgi:hypothetical protein